MALPPETSYRRGAKHRVGDLGLTVAATGNFVGSLAEWKLELVGLSRPTYLQRSDPARVCQPICRFPLPKL